MTSFVYNHGRQKSNLRTLRRIPQTTFVSVFFFFFFFFFFFLREEMGFFYQGKSSSCSPMADWISLGTFILVIWLLYEMFNSLR